MVLGGLVGGVGVGEGGWSCLEFQKCMALRYCAGFRFVEVSCR